MSDEKRTTESIVCQICEKEYSLYGLSSHIKHSHEMSVEDYAEKFGEFRKSKINENNEKQRDVQSIKCEECGKSYSSAGMHTHLFHTHDMTVEEYVEKHGEYRKKQKSRKKRKENSDYQCEICEETLVSDRQLSFHVRKEHDLIKKSYLLKHVFDGEHPKCECGCGQRVKILSHEPYKREYISGHNSKGESNPMYGKHHNQSSLEEMREAAISRDTGKKNTEPERKLKRKLDSLDIDYEHQHETEYGSVDFYLPEEDLLVEVDGYYWHPKEKTSLNFRQLAGVINDYRKDQNLDKLFRLRLDSIAEISKVEDIKKYSYNLDYNFSFRDPIIEEEYVSWGIENKGKKHIRDNIHLLLRFLRTVIAQFPYPESKYTLEEIKEKISSYDYSKVIDEEKKIVKNNAWWIGNTFLKSIFKSYWKSSFKGEPSPIEIWNDYGKLRSIIEYRMGLNNSGEVFDFSLKEVLRGISASRSSISFFKPLVAAAIYDHFIEASKEPVVIDPCAGFGGRMLGFKSVYPDGRYIGIEPNSETYSELLELAEKFKKVELYNKKQEEFDLSQFDETVDLTFTSIPYFDKEVYSQPVSYDSFDDWKGEFVERLKRFPKLLVNVPFELSNYFNYEETYKFVNNASHFESEKDEKVEHLLKCF